MALLAYLVTAVVIWWHAWQSPSQQMLCGCGDPAYFVWFLAFQEHALAHAQDPFFTTLVWVPHGANLLDSTSVVLLGWVLAPLTAIAGPIVSFNVASTLAPVLCAMSARWAFRSVVGPKARFGAFVGGFLYAYNPYMFSVLRYGHLNFSMALGPPLLLGLAHDLFWTQRHPLRSGILIGVVLAAQVLQSTEMLALTAVVAAPALVVAGVFVHRKLLPKLRKSVTGVVGAVCVSLAGSAFPVWYAIAGPRHVTSSPWPNTGLYGTLLDDVYSLGSAYGQLSSGVYGYLGRSGAPSAYLGPILIGLCIAGALWCAWRDRVAAFAVLLGVFAWSSSLGTLVTEPGVWHWNNFRFLPWKAFGRLPVVQWAIPQRLVVFMWLAVGLFATAVLGRLDAALFVRLAAPVRGWIPTAVVACAGLLATVPLLAYGELPLRTERVVAPAWFGAVVHDLPPGATVLVYPLLRGDSSPLVWQALDGFPVRLVGGGDIFVPGPGGKPMTAYSMTGALEILSGNGGRVPDVADLREVHDALDRWRVDAVVTPGVPQDDPVAQFFDIVTGVTPSAVHGALLWRLSALDVTAAGTSQPAAWRGLPRS